MANWNEILDKANSIAHKFGGSQSLALEKIRRDYLQELFELTNRNIIAYYSGWLSKGSIQGIWINDEDKNGFMTTVNNLDRSKGLYLLLHTPGGELTATESIVNYLKKIFGSNIKAIIPQIAMSAGTMIALSCNEIIMGKQSNLGPIDPQFGDIPALGVLHGLERAKKEIQENESNIHIWQPILQRYHLSFFDQCVNAVTMSREFVKEQLCTGIFAGEDNAGVLADNVVNSLSDFVENKEHGKHIHAEELREIGLPITDLEDDQGLQDLVLNIHHCYILTLQNTNSYKAIENHLGVGMFKNLTK